MEMGVKKYVLYIDLANTRVNIYHKFNLNKETFMLRKNKIGGVIALGVAVFLLLTILLQGQGLIYTLALYAQGVFYALALAGWLFSTLRENTLVRIIFFFVQTNLALAHATVSFAAGKRMTVWTPSKR